MSHFKAFQCRATFDLQSRTLKIFFVKIQLYNFKNPKRKMKLYRNKGNGQFY